MGHKRNKPITSLSPIKQRPALQSFSQIQLNPRQPSSLKLPPHQNIHQLK